eukprot:SAG31_NODE_1211_length_9376_cov_2.931767_1_plen_26_part_10
MDSTRRGITATEFSIVQGWDSFRISS